ncbi:hypothetical protein ONS95_004369 [Cadophora gregata]|uniref:uncharacterized protein n=1 Tax=Cadophora gregata TaxID=51156 RepID=UPI0026DBD966|nr:uncharacterized protein ONS95_004369 [Cadophora gregata]KAK0105855.1 hypothetical protein ONS95_004369 [Cadophora gregata]
MAATNRTTFTITQPFLGAPLQFQPALGSKELEALVDAYVIGNGSKKDKLSVVTVEFFNLATVDLNTGALTKTYEVFSFGPMSDTFFEQSPVESQSSGFSPPIFTPSPGSSATFGDSGYGSFSLPSMTPPTRTLGSARVTKKSAKKDTKKPKVDEARLPGFSIMTKDGIDVTTTAGRGTKTKEQREHAHLMRIMKACDACKRKKIRCDPSHRRSQHDMSRASTTTTQSSSASARPSPQYESSPGSSAPALSRQSTQASQRVFTPSNVIDDFVLFPEDSGSWNPEMSEADLGQFNFDINDIEFIAELPVQTNDFSFYQQPYNDFNFDQQLGQSFYQQPQSYSQVDGQQSFSNAPLMTDSFDTPGSYDLDQYMPAAHSRPHPSGSSQDSGQIDYSQQGWPEFSTDTRANQTTPLSPSSDWNVLESSLISDSPGDLHDRSSSTGLASSPLERVSSGRSPLSSSSRRVVNAQGLAATLSTGIDRTTANGASIHPDLNAQHQATALNSDHLNVPAVSYNSGPDGTADPSDILDVPLLASRQRSSPAASTAVLRGLSENCQQVSQSLQTINSSRSEYTGLGKDLQRLRFVADFLSSRQTVVPGAVISVAEQFRSRLNTLSARLGSIVSTGTSNPLLETLDPDFHAEYLRQCQVDARRLVRSLCATINTVQAQNTGTHVTGNTQTLTSGRNAQLFPSPSQGSPQFSLVSGVGMWSESTHEWQPSNGQSANVLREVNTFDILESSPGAYELCSSSMSESESGTLRLSTTRNAPRSSIMVKDAQTLDRQFTAETHLQDVPSVPFFDIAEEYSSMLAYSGIQSQHDSVADRTQTSSTTQYVDSSQETSLAQAGPDSSRSAILQTTVAAQQSSVSLSVRPSLPFVLAVAVLGSLFLGSKVLTSFMTSPFAVLVIQALTSLRESSTEWIGNDSFSVAKLVACAALAAHLPALAKSTLLCGGMALFHLLTGAEKSDGKEISSMSTSNNDLEIDDRCGDKRGLMAMMMDFSPVVAVQ